MSIEAVPNMLLKVTVHGASLATILYAVTAGGAPCDGLIYGETVTTTIQHLRDDDDMATTTESRAALTASICCAATCSFYDEAGELREPVLEELTAAQPAPLLGWLSYRPAPSCTTTATAAASAGPAPSSSSSSCSSGSWLRPSMRESAVTLALLRRQLARHGGRQAVLLLLVSTGDSHNGATLTWQFRCFQARLATSSGEMLLEPLELQTLNLGGHTGLGAYQQLNAATALAGPSPASSTSALSAQQQHAVQVSFSSAAAPSALGGTAAPPGCGHGYDAAAAAAGLVAGAREQARAVRQHCEALLGGLHELCERAEAGEAAVAELRRRRDALVAQLARRR
ncbi:hypothetical protein PLESTM_002000600 [Pleodorina starrii]|nr:hypothetical protein PLESTM_002000600 [Pleodorina starrii]